MLRLAQSVVTHRAGDAQGGGAWYLHLSWAPTCAIVSGDWPQTVCGTETLSSSGWSEESEDWQWHFSYSNTIEIFSDPGNTLGS